MEATLFEQLGEDNLAALVGQFYDLVFAHPRISHLFKSNKEEIKEKQRLFLTQFLGGPPLYSQKHGHPMLRAKHMPHPIGDEDADAWLSCMAQALDTLPVEESLKEELFQRFVPTALFMVNKGGVNS